MTIEQIEAELARREQLEQQSQQALDNGDLLTVGMSLFRVDPHKMIAESPSFANKLLELESRRLEREAELSGWRDKPASELTIEQLQVRVLEHLSEMPAPDIQLMTRKLELLLTFVPKEYQEAAKKALAAL